MVSFYVLFFLSMLRMWRRFVRCLPSRTSLYCSQASILNRILGCAAELRRSQLGKGKRERKVKKIPSVLKDSNRLRTDGNWDFSNCDGRSYHLRRSRERRRCNCDCGHKWPIGPERFRYRLQFISNFFLGTLRCILQFI